MWSYFDLYEEYEFLIINLWVRVDLSSFVWSWQLELFTYIGIYMKGWSFSTRLIVTFCLHWLYSIIVASFSVPTFCKSLLFSLFLSFFSFYAGGWGGYRTFCICSLCFVLILFFALVSGSKPYRKVSSALHEREWSCEYLVTPGKNWARFHWTW